MHAVPFMFFFFDGALRLRPRRYLEQTDQHTLGLYANLNHLVSWAPELQKMGGIARAALRHGFWPRVRQISSKMKAGKLLFPHGILCTCRER